MADELTGRAAMQPGDAKPWRLSVEEARSQAKACFRDRLSNGEQVGDCSCASDEEKVPEGEGSQVVGVRFRDSARVHFFETVQSLDVGTWLACTTSRGQEAGRVVVAPHQVLMSHLDGELKPIDHVLTQDDVERIDQRRKDAARVVRRAGEISRSYDFGVKAVAAEYSLDGRTVELAFSASDHSFVEDLRETLAKELGISVDMRHVGPRDGARLIGGLGKCGRLPGSLSYENEQYRKAKQILPRLGQRITTFDGEGMVISLQVLEKLVTVQYAEPYREVTYPAAELSSPRSGAPRAAAADPEEQVAMQGGAAEDSVRRQPPRSRRRRRMNRPQE